jgi:hypothetical protein
MFKTVKNYELSKGRKNENFLPISKEAENISIASPENEILFIDFLKDILQNAGLSGGEKETAKKLILEERLSECERKSYLPRLRRKLQKYAGIYSPHTSGGGQLTRYTIYRQDADVLKRKDKYEIAEICSLSLEKQHKAKFAGFKHICNAFNKITGFSWLYPIWKFNGIKRDDPKPKAYKLPEFLGGNYITIPKGQEARFTLIKSGIRESYNLENEEAEREFEIEENSQGVRVYQAYRKEMKKHLKEILPQVDYLSRFEYKATGR